MFKSLLNKQIAAMHEYQKANNISRECITNVKYILDCLPVKSKNIQDTIVNAFIVVGKNKETNDLVVISGHLALVIDDQIIEPSYEIEELTQKQYYKTYEEYTNFLQNHNILVEHDINEVQANHQKFIEIAEALNKNDYDRINDTYYDEQANYVDKLLF
jgi:hypothetical protein